MSDDEALNDLAVRMRQLEAHLVRSPEYVAKVGRTARMFAAVLALALVIFFGEELLYVREPRPEASVVLGSIDLTRVVLLVRTWRCRRRLNKNWLSPDARKTLEALQRERTERSSPGAPAGRTT
jgi:hypothetical protein